MLFLMFGSVIVPLKALVMNALSLTATFGAMVWIFQDGHLSGLLGFTATGNGSSRLLPRPTPMLAVTLPLPDALVKEALQ